jgi:hypothetical protein
MRSLMNFTHQIKNNKMGGACSTNKGKVHMRFSWGNPGERNDLEVLGMDGRILNSNSRKLVWDMDCIDLVQDRDRWNAVVQAAMDLPVT